MMMVKFDPTTYNKIKNEVKEMFRNEKVGRQQTYESQSELFQSIINNTKEVVQNLNSVQRSIDRINDEKQSLNNILALKDTDHRLALRQQIQDMSGLTDVFSEPRESTPITPRVNLNRGFNETDMENLQDLNLPLPGEVFHNIGEIPEILKEVTTKIKSLAQEFRDDRLSKKSDKEKEIYNSQRNTLDRSKKRLKYIQESKQVVGEGKKKNYALVYNNANNLLKKLEEYITAYHAGNNEVYNTIITILDELLNNKIIYKNTHDQILKSNNL